MIVTVVVTDAAPSAASAHACWCSHTADAEVATAAVTVITATRCSDAHASIRCYTVSIAGCCCCCCCKQ